MVYVSLPTVVGTFVRILWPSHCFWSLLASPGRVADSSPPLALSGAVHEWHVPYMKQTLETGRAPISNITKSQITKLPIPLQLQPSQLHLIHPKMPPHRIPSGIHTIRTLTILVSGTASKCHATSRQLSNRFTANVSRSRWLSVLAQAHALCGEGAGRKIEAWPAARISARSKSAPPCLRRAWNAAIRFTQRSCATWMANGAAVRNAEPSSSGKGKKARSPLDCPLPVPHLDSGGQRAIT
jgi:hypothetical protein